MICDSNKCIISSNHCEQYFTQLLLDSLILHYDYKTRENIATKVPLGVVSEEDFYGGVLCTSNSSP